MTDKIFSFSTTETGYNHIKAEPSKVCEDASDFYDDEKMHICIVADGHGSDNYPRTDRGSQYAVDATIEQIKAFVQKIYNPDPENPEKSVNESNELIEKFLYSKIDETHQLKNLSKSILIRWRELVDKDVEENPFHESDMLNVSDKYKKIYMSENISERRADKAYGCTLIAYVVTENFSFGMQIGDGKCVVIDKNGTFSEPIPWDENCQMNVTTSICDSDAADEFRFFVTEEKPSAVFCGSDGIDDSYANVEEMYALYRSIIKIFIEYGSDVGKAEIKEYLPVLTKKGSGDDVSIAFIMDIQRVTELTPVFTVQTELFNLESQLKEKQHMVAVNEEKEKALISKLSTMMRPGIRTPLDHQIYNQIIELRANMTQMDEEILILQKKIDDLKFRIPKVVAMCKSVMTEVNETADSDSAVKTEEEIAAKETVVAECGEIVACAENMEEVAAVNKEVAEVESQGIVSEQSAAEEIEVSETEEKASSEHQKIVISEKTVSIDEQMAKVSQVSEQSAADEEVVGDTKDSVAEIPEE